MPGYDKSGPMGAGPMTGGGRGRCNPDFVRYFMPFSGDCRRGVGFRRGFRGGISRHLASGRGYGQRSGFYPTTAGVPVPMGTAEEIDILKAEADKLRSALKGIDNRIQTLSMRPTEET
jgi:hypothetical protein